MTTLRRPGTREKGKLPAKVLHAEQALRSQAYQTTMNEWELVQAAKKLAPAWQSYNAKYVLMSTTHWGDGSEPTVLTVSQHGHAGWDAARVLLVAMRSMVVNCPAGNLTITHQLVLEVEHPENKAWAYIDVETGTVKKSKHWPEAAEATTGEGGAVS